MNDGMENRPDLRILTEGGISLYNKTSVLEEDIRWFQNSGLEVIKLNCEYWTMRNFHQSLKAELEFPEPYADNINAFNDAVRNLADRTEKGLVLVFMRMDLFHNQDETISESILDILSKNSREWLVKGKKLVTLVQSADANISFEKLGGIIPTWNPGERRDSHRQAGS